MDLADLKEGKRSAVARAITMVENDPAKSRKLIREIFAETGGSDIIGITGPAGAGKSSLIDRIVLGMGDAKPAVLAVDPTSHISGGAILGDRVRMTESTDSGVYIRSIASRGATGAVSYSLRNSIRVLEYAGFDPIIIESVGAGQTEVEIAGIADVTVVVFNPNSGDNIQAIKAGLTEIGDIYLVNKSDLRGANMLYDSVRDFIGDSDRAPPVLKTSVKKGTGIDRFIDVLAGMLADRRNVKGRESERLAAELKDIVLNNIREKVDEVSSEEMFSRYVKRLESRKTDPFDAGRRIARSILR